MREDFVKTVDGRVSEVLVLTFEDGVTLWRHGLSADRADEALPSFFFRSCDGKIPTARSGNIDQVRLPDGRQISVLSSLLLARSGGVERATSSTRHLRTTLEYLGAVRKLQTPLPIGADRAPDPTVQNPYVGTFSAETEEEARASLGALDGELQSLAEGAVRVVGEPVFSGGTSLWVRRSRGCLEAMARRRVVCWGGPEEGFVERWADLSPWMPFSSVVELYPWLTAGTERGRRWLVLPEGEALAWWSDHTIPFTSPLSSDESEVCRLVGEDLPWLWPASSLAVWAEGRWP